MKTRICALLLVLVLFCTMTTGVMAAETAQETALLVEATSNDEVITVKVLLHGGQGVTNGRVVLSYDAEILTLTGTEAVSGFGKVSVNAETAGQVALAWVGSEITEDITLLTATFTGGVGRVTFTAESADLYMGKEKLELPIASASVSFNPFEDIDNHWARAEILESYYAGLFKGITETRFAPENTITRAMFVTVLYRMAGEPNVDGLTTSFTDLTEGEYYVPAVLWATEAGITNGISQTQFAPGKTLSRQELATMLYRYAEASGQDVSGEADLSGFKDAAAISDWADEAMGWAVDAGILEGFPGGYMMATISATRAQTAVIFCRYLDLM